MSTNCTYSLTKINPNKCLQNNILSVMCILYQLEKLKNLDLDIRYVTMEKNVECYKM